MIDAKNIEQMLTALDRQIGARGGAAISLAVCGGAALFALGLVSRTTKDVDVLGEVVRDGEGSRIKKIDGFPDTFEEASRAVQRDFGLPEGWINTGPAMQAESGFPAGFEERLVARSYGAYLTIYFASRLDQVHFKLYAAMDRGGYHVDDLFALNPTPEEIEMAVQWVLTQDVSEGFRTILKDFLEKRGYDDISEKV